MSDSQPTRRSVCPLDYALGIFGDRWTLLVVRDLIFGGKRHFREMRDSGEGIASNILADRLKKLEALGLVTRVPDPENRRQVLYEPTEKALDLAPALVEIIRWSGTHDPETAVSRKMLQRIKRERDTVVEEFLEAARKRRAGA